MKKRIGHYAPSTQEKGKNEAAIGGVKEGKLFWTVYMGEGCYFDVTNQFEAEILSKLVKIEHMLKKLK